MIDPEGEEKYFYEAVCAYVDLLKDENIGAIGVNFNGIIEVENREQARRLLKEKILDKSEAVLRNSDTASVVLVRDDKHYKFSKFQIRIEAGEIVNKDKDIRKTGVLVNFNYHTDLQMGEERVNQLEGFEKRIKKIQDSVSAYVEEIEGSFND